MKYFGLVLSHEFYKLLAIKETHERKLYFPFSAQVLTLALFACQDTSTVTFFNLLLVLVVFFEIKNAWTPVW